jgi:transposase
MRVLVAVCGSVGEVFLWATASLVYSKEEVEVQDRVRLGWAGIDVGKGHHWICLIDEAGRSLWSTKVDNDEAALLDMISGVLARADEVVWGLDVTGTMSGLLLALLAAHGQRVKYVAGRTVNQMAGAYRGEAKTDARDAYVIAETLRLRGDLQEVAVATALVTGLRLLVTHRTDLVGDRVRMINRLRDVLLGYFPALERAFDYAHSRGALVLLTGYQTPQTIRRTGESRLRAWLAKQKVRGADQVAATALAAARTQQTVVPGQDVAASIVADLATQLLAIGTRIGELDAQITTTFRAHPQAEIIESLPGMGPILGAELIAATGDLAGYADAGRLASAAGLVPVPRDSGRRTGNLHRPMRYSRKLRRVFYLSASTAMMRVGPNRDYYLKKRGQGLGHVQALIALARRRVDVLWALLRDNRTFELTPPMRQTTAQPA